MKIKVRWVQMIVGLIDDHVLLEGIMEVESFTPLECLKAFDLQQGGSGVDHSMLPFYTIREFYNGIYMESTDGIQRLIFLNI